LFEEGALAVVWNMLFKISDVATTLISWLCAYTTYQWENPRWFSVRKVRGVARLILVDFCLEGNLNDHLRDSLW